jgi:hypothetical protein
MGPRVREDDVSFLFCVSALRLLKRLNPLYLRSGAALQPFIAKGQGAARALDKMISLTVH